MANFGAWLRGLFGSASKQDLFDSDLDSDQKLKSAPSLPDVNKPFSQPPSFAKDNNDFALAMYRQFQHSGNLFFSPFSLRTALGMTYAGARGETAKQIGAACRFLAEDENLHTDFSEIIRRLNTSISSKCVIEIANSLWGQDGTPLKAEFLDLIAKHYEGGMNLVDFRQNAEAVRMIINQWVDDKTRHKIRDIISGSLDPDTRLILVNAIYFKGIWGQQFSKEDTRNKPFYLDGGATVQAPLMFQQEDFRYLKGEGFQAVNLGYKGSDLSMLVLLPDQKDGLRELEERLTSQMLHDCVAGMTTREVALYMPRFKITWGTVDLTNQFSALGMPLAFDRSQADFSGINGYQTPDEEALVISAVFHKAFVEVTEEGTEAAAATAVAIMAGSAMAAFDPPPVPIFRADHPFLFAIRDRVSGVILFLGRMADPTK